MLSVNVCFHRNLNTIVFALESTLHVQYSYCQFPVSQRNSHAFSSVCLLSQSKNHSELPKNFIGLSKTDSTDAYIISGFSSGWQNQEFSLERQSDFALKRLTRHRLHLAECITREKTYMISNLFLKFSELEILDQESQPFSNIFGTTSAAVLTEFFSVQDICGCQRRRAPTISGKKKPESHYKLS